MLSQESTCLNCPNSEFNLEFVLNTIGDCILKYGSPGMIKVLSTLFVQAGVTGPVNSFEQICRCPGDSRSPPNSCLKPLSILNDAIYDMMTCMLHHHLVAVTIFWERIF